tara:strand:+ start:228 stop:1322 length:1095 start_codon:yes stop_codon:yes gene_type:complete
MGFFSDLFKGKITASPNQPNSPQSQSTNDSNQAIQNLIDNKDKYQNNLVAGDNRNEYQMRMNALRTGQTFDPSNFSFTDRSGNQINAGSDNRTVGNASGAAAYGDRFPLSNFAMKAGPAIAKTAMGGLFPGGGLIMDAFGKAKDAGVDFYNSGPGQDVRGMYGDTVGAIVDQGMDFIQDNFMTSGSITEKPEEVDEFRNYLNNLKGLNASAGSGISPLLDTPASAVNPINRDGQIQRDPTQITVEDVAQQGLDGFFGGQSQTDSREDFDRRIPPKKTTQDYIDEFNEQFSLNDRLELFGKNPNERQMILDQVSGYSEIPNRMNYKMGIDPDNNKMYNQLAGENRDMSLSDFMIDNPGGGVFNLR